MPNCKEKRFDEAAQSYDQIHKMIVLQSLSQSIHACKASPTRASILLLIINDTLVNMSCCIAGTFAALRGDKFANASGR